MSASDEKTVEKYKKLEAELNKILLSTTNSLSFISFCGEAMEHHLDQVEAIRKASQQLLEVMDMPDKDDIATIAHKKIECEGRLDSMDDRLYETMIGINGYRSEIADLIREVEQLSASMNRKIDS